jgi:hypothetical protein
MRARPLALALVLALPAVATAQYDPIRSPPGRRQSVVRDQGINLSARVGFGVPSGDISDDRDAAGNKIDPALDDLVNYKIPIWLELGYRFNPSVWGGLYLELAPAKTDRSFCVSGRDCSSHDVRFGVDMQLHFAPYNNVDPWLGLGIGAEFLAVKAFDPSINDVSKFTWAGLEFPLLEAGLDLALSPRATIGPYVAWSIGYYTRYGVESPGFAGISGSISDKAIHTWFQIGVKGTLKL